MVVETHIASAMAAVEEQNTAKNAKLDDIVAKMAALTNWMKSVDEATSGLAKNTALLQLHTEDTASRLGLLEDNAAARRTCGGAPITPPTTVVRIDADKQPHGHGDVNHARGQDSGLNRPPDPPLVTGMSRPASHLFDR